MAAAAAGAEAGIEKAKLMTDTLRETGHVTVTTKVQLRRQGMFASTEAGIGGSGRAKQETGHRRSLLDQLFNLLWCVLRFI